MQAGGKFLVSAAVLAVAACGGESGKLEIRSTPTALAAGEHPVSFRVAEARGQLALGNVALALEGFRKAWRDDPNSIDALAGMADCYDRMGRFDLSRRNYEAALAIAPANLTLLGALASSLDQQGDRDGAGKVRQEIALRTAVAKVQATAVARAQPDESVAAAEAELVRLVAPVPVAAAAPVAPVVAPASNVVTALKSAQVVAPVLIAAPLLAVAEALASPLAPTRAAPKAVAASTVTVKLPLVRAASPVNAKAVSFPAKAAMVERAPLQPSGPHLERLSMGEIALISTAAPMWRPTTVAQTARSTTVRFVPLREASTVPVQVRLLNAARINRLAARTRSWLVARGWYGLGVGDADTVRAQSVILYPAGKRALAQTLSSQFGFAMQERASGSQITILLGRDAARHPALREVHG